MKNLRYNLISLAVLAIILSLAVTSQAATVTIDNQNIGSSVWFRAHDNTATQQGVTGPGTPPLGTGSWQFSTGSGTGSGQGGKSYLYFTGVNFLTTTVKPSDFTTLSYSTYVVSRQTGTSVAPYWNMQYDLNGNGKWDGTGVNGDAYLIFEPANNGHKSTDVGIWQTWDVANGNWWSNQYLGGGNFKLSTLHNKIFSLDLLAGQSSGGDWANAVGDFDAVTIGIANGAIFANTTYNFENNPVPLPGSLLLLGSGLVGLVIWRKRRAIMRTGA